MDLDRFVEDAQTPYSRIEVRDANGNVVDRGDLTLRYTAHEGTTVDGLMAGDRLYFDGILRYDHDATMNLAGCISEHMSDVPQVYFRG